MRKPQRSEPRPSPLAQVQYTRPLSHLPEEHPPPEMGLVRDPQFWKRFSAAAHMAEDEEKNSVPSSATSVESKYGAHWLAQQHKEKRRTKYMCASITLVVALIITAGAVCGWYFTHHKV